MGPLAREALLPPRYTPCMTKLYDRRADKITLDEIERIVIK